MKIWVFYLIFLIYIEIIFHIACFGNFKLINFILLLFLNIIISSCLTIISSLFKKEKINSFITKIIISFITILFCAELIYFKIYESFFSIKGVVFVGALKDGFDKILLTLSQNAFVIVILLLPTIISLIKFTKIVPRINKMNLRIISVLSIVSLGYTSFFIYSFERNNDFCLYNLLFNVNMPILNVKNFGLIPSASLSLERSIFGFEAKIQTKEDDYSNKKTSLADKMNIKYNETNIDFETLINNENNQTIKNIHEYFSSQTPTIKNNYTGLFEGKNLIFIMAESFDEIAIHETLTPTLYKLKNEGIIFDNYFSPKYPAGTADGEYMLEWATLPIIGENYSLIDMVYNTNPYILPRNMKSQGYSTYAYHNYYGYYNSRKSYFTTLNFDDVRFCSSGINMYCDKFHGSDVDMMEQTPSNYLEKDKFFVYYITLSGHGSYDGSNFVAEKHIGKLNGYDYPYQLKYYLAANIDFDIAMERLIQQLRDANKLDDTVIIISSDHSPYYLTNDQYNYLSKVDRNNKFDLNRGSLIIYNSELTHGEHIKKYAMNIDVLPTILNLFNIEYDSRILIGKDIMATNNDGLVVLPDRSWITNYGSYDSSNQRFNKFVDSVDDKYPSRINQEVNEKYQVSISMQYNDYYKYIFN